MDCPAWDSDKAEKEDPQLQKDVHAANRAACEGALEQPPERRHMEGWHQRAFKRVVPVHYYAGNIRQDDPQKICLGIDVGVGDHPGEHFRNVAYTLDRLCKTMNAQLRKLDLDWDTTPSHVRARKLAGIVGVAVGEFIRIHPFVNGNGRTSRMLWGALLFRMGLEPQVTVLQRPLPTQVYERLMTKCMQGIHSELVLYVLDRMEKPYKGLPASEVANSAVAKRPSGS